MKTVFAFLLLAIPLAAQPARNMINDPRAIEEYLLGTPSEKDWTGDLIFKGAVCDGKPSVRGFMKYEDMRGVIINRTNTTFQNARIEVVVDTGEQTVPLGEVGKGETAFVAVIEACTTVKTLELSFRGVSQITLARKAREAREEAQAREKARLEVERKCAALKARIANKRVGELTVTESDQMGACKKLRLW